MECSAIEHDCVKKWCDVSIPVMKNGLVSSTNSKNNITMQIANSETGILQEVPRGIALTDAVQAVGKIDCNFSEMLPQALFLASHKVCGQRVLEYFF